MTYPPPDGRSEHNSPPDCPRQDHAQDGYPQQGYPQQGRQPMAAQPQPAWDAGVPTDPIGLSSGGSGGGSGKALAVIGIVAILLIGAVVAVGVVTYRQVNSHQHGSPVADSSPAGPSSLAPPSSATPPASQSGSGTTAPERTQCPTATPASNTPAGWHTVAGKRGLSYDVPANWKVASCGTLVGWEKRCDSGPFGYCPIRTMSGAASLETAQCRNDSVGVSGLPGASDTTDINEAVQSEASLVADIYTSESGHVPQVQLGASQRLTVGGAPAVQVIATVTDIEPSACVGPTAIHSMVATTVPGQPGCVLFVISLPQGVPGAADPADVSQMVSTLRRAG
ncbi:hypothetical protein ACLQ3C_00960 [Gordonia sp. DT30]|uniref:hypothetical protein n=1 Tax=Gordonia sp. DT30 TaxID=3416546 RepID=UPI003CF0A163